MPAFAETEPSAAIEEPKPDPRDLALARLEAERDELQRQIELLRADWQTELGKAEMRAKAEAAREHVRDDEARLAVLAKALSDARQKFDASLGQNQADLTTRLAAEALSRLVEPNRHDLEWLARAIERRLAELRAQSVTALRVAPGALAPEALARLRQRLAAGASIETDPDLAPGQALIELQLGAAQLELSAGLAAVIAQLEASVVEP
ncbi:MAG: hypothetical protein C0515_01275 [Novosphingobium sp.]|nr:hypothetical protein [Novosphingobium sp.]